MINQDLTILLVGTADTKSDELADLRQRINELGARVLLMDVGVLAAGHVAVDISNQEVALAGGRQLQQVVNAGDENTAMLWMAQGAAHIASRLHAEGRIHGFLALGGTMGTDLAFDVAAALPLGVPKVIISTVAYSHLIPPERITPDLIMVMWAGGLFGLNSLCQSALAQGAGAVVGASRAAAPPNGDRPLIGMTSLGKSCLSYMVTLKPALEARGYEVAVFHATGMGGRAFEALAAAGRFVAVMDFCLQELANHVGGSVVTAGPSRLTGAGFSGTPQIVAPGAVDMIDFPAWQSVPTALQGRPVHIHNRLIASATSPPALRARIANEIATRLAQAKGPSCFVLPLQGVEQWDRPGEPLYDAPGLEAFVQAMRNTSASHQTIELDAHINDDAFAQKALAIFDSWVAQGVVPQGKLELKVSLNQMVQKAIEKRVTNKIAAPRALVLDFGGVISRTLFETHALTEAELGLAPGTLTWHGPFEPEGDALWREMQAERITERDYWLSRAREVGRLLGEDWSHMETLVRRARGTDPAAVIRPEAIEAIHSAKAAGYRLAVLSNELDLFYGADFREKLPLLKHFEVIVDATYTGVLKPDARAYQEVLDRLEVPAEQAVFVDDQLRNVQGALAIGMQAVHFDVRQPAVSYALALNKCMG